MKICYIIHSTIMGGATISFLNMVSGMKSKGVEILVVFPQSDIFFEQKMQSIGINYKIIPLMSSYLIKYDSTFAHKLVFYIKLLPRIAKIEFLKYKSLKSLTKVITEFSPDIIHTNTGVIHEGYKCAKRLGIPHIWHVREYQDLDFHWKIIPSKKIYLSYLRDSYVITITNHLLHYFHLDSSSKSIVIYNGIMLKNDIHFDWPKKKYFVCSSRISPEKGHEDTIRAFSNFYSRHRDFRLCIMGFGDEVYIDYLKEISRDLGCSEAIEWLGFQTDIKQYMRTATAQIVSSRFEAFGRMTAEACFCGCITIGRNTGGTAEILTKTGGLLFDTIEQLTLAMDDVSSYNQSQYKSMAMYAQRIAQDTYSIESNVDQIYHFYKEIIN